MSPTRYWIFVVLLVVLFSASVSRAERVVLAADAWCPLNCEPEAPLPGFMVEIARVVFEEAGYDLVYLQYPWARALYDTRQGKINGVIGAFRGDAPDFVFPKVEQAMLSGTAFFTRKGSRWRYHNPADLPEVRLGAVVDYDYGVLMNDYIRHQHDSTRVELVSGVQPLRRNIQKLMFGDIDAVIAAAPVFWYNAHQMGLADQAQFAGRASEREASYIAFSPRHPRSEHYAELLSIGTHKLRESGELNQILARYGIQDWRAP